MYATVITSYKETFSGRNGRGCNWGWMSAILISRGQQYYDLKRIEEKLSWHVTNPHS